MKPKPSEIREAELRGEVRAWKKAAGMLVGVASRWCESEAKRLQARLRKLREEEKKR